MSDKTPIDAPMPNIAENETPKTAEDLKELTSNANLQYSLKKYEKAAELYTEALQLQDEINGEMVAENAELHYLYGRCLFKVAVLNSDVLGGGVASEKPKAGTQAPKEETNAEASALGINDADGDVEDEDEDGEAQGEDGEEEDDDFQTAYEILEVARVLYERQLDTLQTAPKDESGEGAKGKGKASSEMTPKVRKITECLADTHDLQSEISLENERFGDAAEESKSTLRLRQTLYPIESEMIAEGHYKVAIAQEFAFFDAVRESKEAQEKQNGASGDAKKDIDPKLLFDAVENLVYAIQSSELRIAAQETSIPELSDEEQEKKKPELADLKDIVQDMFAKVCGRTFDKKTTY
jgi:HAT1-interacting factor 1